MAPVLIHFRSSFGCSTVVFAKCASAA